MRFDLSAPGHLALAGLAVLVLLATLGARSLRRGRRSHVQSTADEEMLVGLVLLPERLTDGSGSAAYQLTLLPTRPLRSAVVSVGTLDAPFARQHVVGQLTLREPIRLTGTLPLERQDHWIRVAVDCAGEVRSYRFARQLP